MKKYGYDDKLKILYKSTKKEPFFVDVPKMNYITYIGKGHPNESDFQEACNSLFTLSYIIKFKIIKKNKEIDYKVNSLEVNWFLDKTKDKINFTWKAMIMQPDFITEEDYIEGVKIAKESGKILNYDNTKFESIDFGKCIQCFHKGDYNNMNSTMYKMQNFAKENNLDFDLYTHDIYLNDSRKTRTENLKSIMRIGVRKKNK